MYKLQAPRPICRLVMMGLRTPQPQAPTTSCLIARVLTRGLNEQEKKRVLGFGWDNLFAWHLLIDQPKRQACGSDRDGQIPSPTSPSEGGASPWKPGFVKGEPCSKGCRLEVPATPPALLQAWRQRLAVIGAQ